MDYYILNNGVKIPKIGFGTWQIENGNICYEAVKNALKVGYRHIDTASAYGNEESVGKAIKDSLLPRKEVFITSKIPAEIKTYDEAKKYIEKSLKLLNVDYIDLMIIHAPRPWSEMTENFVYDYKKENVNVYRALEEAYLHKKLRAIGVSNFSIEDLQNILENCQVIPMVNQIPHFIGYPQKELCSFCAEKHILVEAYSPFRTGKIFQNKEIEKLADKYHTTSADICLAFCYQRNTLPLPKSTHYDRIKANFEYHTKLSEDDLKYLESLTI